MKKNKQLQKLVARLVEASFKDGRMIESQVSKSIKLLKTYPKAKAILALSEYLKSLKRMERQYTIYIESSIPLPLDVVNRMKRVVSKKMTITKVITSVNPQILGGFKLKIGDEIWDESILGRINQIKEVLIGRSSSSNKDLHRS